MTATPRLTIAVDFDNTLCEEAWPGIGKPKPGAADALKFFRTLGYYIIISSCRTCHWNYDVYGGDPNMPTMDRPAVKEMVAWLAANKMEYDLIDDGSRGKVMADFTVCDKAIRYENNWPQIAHFIAKNGKGHRKVASKEVVDISLYRQVKDFVKD